MVRLVRKSRFPLWEWTVIMLCTAFFLLPLAAMARFALQRVPVAVLGRDTLFTRWTLSGAISTLTDAQFRPSFLLSTRLGLLTTAVVLVLMLPTVLWVHSNGARWRSTVEILCTLPYVVPPIALVVGVSGAFRNHVPWIVTSDYGLIPLYAVLCLPFAFRTLDAGVSAIDLRTLVDAGRNLGAGPTRNLVSVLLPNLRVPVLAAGFLCFAVVMGEFAIASLLLKPTLPAYMVAAQGQEPQGAMAVALLLLLLTTVLYFLVGRLGRRGNLSGRMKGFMT